MGLTIVPLMAGLDTVFDRLVDREQCLAPIHCPNAASRSSSRHVNRRSDGSDCRIAGGGQASDFENRRRDLTVGD